MKPQVEAVFHGDRPQSVGIDEGVDRPADIRRILAPKPPRLFNGEARAGVGIVRITPYTHPFIRLYHLSDGIPPMFINHRQTDGVSRA
jgi:hypothetical protein